MNFKLLASTLGREGGVSGGGNIATVSSATGEVARLVNWIRQANADIQGLYFDWKFLWMPFSLTTEADKPDYNAPLEWHYWAKDKARYGSQPLKVVEWELWDQFEDDTPGEPRRLVLMPDGSIKVLPTPDGAYTITMPFYRKPQHLQNDSDLPLIPEPFHDLIWMWALVKYAYYEAAPEALERVRTEYPDRLRALEAHQLPNRDRYQLAMDPNPITVVPE